MSIALRIPACGYLCFRTAAGWILAPVLSSCVWRAFAAGAVWTACSSFNQGPGPSGLVQFTLCRVLRHLFILDFDLHSIAEDRLLGDGVGLLPLVSPLPPQVA